MKTLPRARGDWCLDSGGFSELSMYGEWRTGVTEYRDAIERYAAEVGNLAWAAPQDWMCEPHLLHGRTVHEHQTRTILSYLQLRESPVVPVLQGWEPREYLAHVEQYAAYGVDLREVPVVGLGSVCRRQHTAEIEKLIVELAGDGIALHGFGFKKRGLVGSAPFLASADSMAWSYEARRKPPMEGCCHGKTCTGNCANCIRWAMRWRVQLMNQLGEANGTH